MRISVHSKNIGGEPLTLLRNRMWRDRMQDECTLAAKYTLREPLIPGWFEEIELITSTELLSLLTYHQKCSKAVVALKDVLSWVFPDINLDHDYPCEGGRRRTTSNCGDWCGAS
ncbi:hypothetical protein PISMIDRAFT_644105 [Pisolithus microcarpus 441]|uniref:Unplaced genomic scaffold scaffold_293, whole genome shotgun sequence n=1 Tax=Pisolithus microcarpus 441 TaxID=765257 RepID=A0A0C9YIW7_9AGAM|nr:hypothetical protein BKA83DRAFT_644105 [Pisolithus microcarpus]KIK13734.1 hypothetical protein PISMIDRAFT_644105 [Pisolithus microcarpus 441]